MSYDPKDYYTFITCDYKKCNNIMCIECDYNNGYCDDCLDCGYNDISDEDNKNASAQAKTILGRVGSLIQTDKGLPTTEFWFIVLIAIAGGVLLARTHCTDDADITTAIIGTGISTSVLPPIIAGAMLFAMGSEHSIPKFMNGLLLSMINILAIFVSYMATLYLSRDT